MPMIDPIQHPGNILNDLLPISADELDEVIHKHVRDFINADVRETDVLEFDTAFAEFTDDEKY